MRRILIIPFFIMILVVGCVMEPPTTVYSFRIVNKTKVPLNIDFRTIKYNESGSDTLLPDQEFEKEIIQLGAFKDYKDTLISHFFSKLKIGFDNGDLNIDPFERGNWTDSVNLKGFWNQRGGTIYYKLIISNKF